MIKLLDFILCSGVVLMELIEALVVALVVQIISYKVFNINLYKILDKMF